MKRVLVSSLAVLPLLVGCSVFRGDPVPPNPALVGVQAQNAAWAGQIERTRGNEQARFAPLTDAREAVEQARAQAGVEAHDAESLRRAESALAEAEAGWNELAAARRPDAARLAAVANAAHRAQRLAEIARFTAIREINLEQLAAMDAPLRQRQSAAPATASDAELLGQQVIPDRLGAVAFQPGTARLTAASGDIVGGLADLLRNNPEYGVAIFGHTDNVAPANATLKAFVAANEGLEEQAPTRAEQVRAFNLALSAARARAVAQRLVDNGIEARRIGARGFGDTRPVASNDTAAGRQANRRVVAVIVPGPDSPEAQGASR